ncbi:GntR family transcriptional regulator [Sodalis sp. RH15]|uniref:GntR family transcriptional regulator n=1 Tax=Sodalis sp. RH15 TaxID=3394330 RepID=UPI0039B471BF
MPKAFDFNNHELINLQVYRFLRNEIISCSIAPGSVLSEKEISLYIGVSRQLIREAFIKLAEAGLVQILPQRGTFVRRISAKRVAEARYIRQVIECAVVRRACACITDEQVLSLEHNLRRQALAADNDKFREFFDLDDSYHQALADIAECQLAWKTIESIKSTMDRVRYLSLSVVSPPRDLIAEHYHIFDGLKKRDADAAEQALRRHLGHMILSIDPIAAQHPDWFEG